MTTRLFSIARARHVVLVVVCLLAMESAGTTVSAQTPSARDLYQAAQASDREARVALAQSSDRPDATLSLVRVAMRAYKTVVLRHPTSGYCDDALWYGAQLGADAFARFGQERDRKSTVALLKLLQSEYPASPFIPRVEEKLDHLVAPEGATTAPARSAAAAGSPPATPATNSRGGYSIARQLGLRVGRVVIDPGHGGSDPGALGADISEAAITLDIALKLEALLAQATGVDVVLTRRSDVYVGLQERTAIANRDGADLFVSIHVNANRDRSIQGIETFLLNFASTPGAAAVAARENAGSTTTMSRLDTMVKQIALTNKLDESRDLAAQLQAALVKRLRGTDKGLRNLGVKQVPFVVLIGASMPSVLVEVAFLTNRHEGQLLATKAYRQRIAESLSDGVTRYLRSLKKGDGVAGLPSEKSAAKLR
ncbi:MAG: N-acetylmuramoyl-L-alanine amidase [Acidobacteria bacterium]|nr:N-acetylmuramoyl-L-alanine amidase [Acidobacteriota bacterium]